MNVKNLAKQCEMVIKLSNGSTNAELDFVYNTAKEMVANDLGKSSCLIFRGTPSDVNLSDVCTFMRNLRVWQFYVIGDMALQYQWQQVANLRDIVMVGDEYAMRFRL